MLITKPVAGMQNRVLTESDAEFLAKSYKLSSVRCYILERFLSVLIKSSLVIIGKPQFLTTTRKLVDTCSVNHRTGVMKLFN